MSNHAEQTTDRLLGLQTSTDACTDLAFAQKYWIIRERLMSSDKEQARAVSSTSTAIISMTKNVTAPSRITAKFETHKDRTSSQANTCLLLTAGKVAVPKECRTVLYHSVPNRDRSVFVASTYLKPGLRKFPHILKFSGTRTR